jgi:hypothetical protein
MVPIGNVVHVIGNDTIVHSGYQTAYVGPRFISSMAKRRNKEEIEKSD